MPRWSRILLIAAALAAIGFLSVETRRLAELAGTFEVAARTAVRERAVAAGERDDARATSARLSAELRAANGRLQAMSDLVEQRAEARRSDAAEAEAAAARSLQPMPDGVRACLRALHGCLRAEGFTAQRFLSARALDDQGLHEVELLDLQGDGLGVSFVRAGRMAASLDRATGRFELRFFDGERTVAGERTALPDDGWPLVFAPVDGHRLEEQLPFLVQATGAYPESAPSAASDDVDPLTRRRWLERFDHLLAEVAVPERWQVTRFRGMRDGCFLDAELVGTDDRNHVVAMSFCHRLAVEIDAEAGVVSLLLRDGNLRRAGVDSNITAEGYRILLPKLTARQASDTMFGMVVTR
ncbi:MAG: hypothetical protein JNM25_02460 [Planctomycetes bacterium]|nr:hypothetical protein [Planctomycetota bacterium]